MANKRVGVTLDINADISQVRTAADQMKKLFESSNFDFSKSRNLQTMFSNLSRALDELQQKSSGTMRTLSDARGVERASQKVESLLTNIGNELKNLGNSNDNDLARKIIGLSDSLKTADSAFKEYERNIESNIKEEERLKKSLSDVTKAYEEQAKNRKRFEELSGTSRGSLREAGINKSNAEAQVRLLSQQYNDITTQVNQAKEAVRSFAEENKIVLTQKGEISQRGNSAISQEDLDTMKNALSVLKDLEQKQQELKGKLSSAQETSNKANENYTNLTKEYDALKNLVNEYEKLESVKQKIEDAQRALDSFTNGTKDAAAFDKLKQTLRETFGEELVEGAYNLDTLKQRLENLKADKLEQLKNIFPEINRLLRESGDSAQQSKGKIDKLIDSLNLSKQAEKEISQVASRLKYFFSLMGGFQLFKRAIRSAISTIKELDAAMTQTAVVSTNTVGQMWKTLPQYTAEAKKLAASIKDVYSAQTLYVQQGLDMNSALGLGLETLKMARVAGIDAATATDSMTAALRGFKMELTEASATRINDVYSKLAQNTASNVQEISTAMSKVASLANSANMSFENTAAFLSKIIESTRESAETAGTALKTVFARFTEVKTLFDQNELLGTDEEGQEIDVNKISKALRTAGINMNEFFTGQKGLDEILIELGKKWDSLTTIQQRYIATQAAGSRQQSRFLALMQDFNRTLELTDMAYNSAGSGQEQYEKTLESIQAKTTKFKDEWQSFIMGISNNDAVKWIVDAGTTILSTLNQIIDKISGGNGLIKALLSLAAAFGTFAAGKALFTNTLGKVGGALGLNTTQRGFFGAGGTLVTGFSNTKNGLKNLFNNPFGIFQKNGVKLRADKIGSSSYQIEQNFKAQEEAYKQEQLNYNKAEWNFNKAEKDLEAFKEKGQQEAIAEKEGYNEQLKQLEKKRDEKKADLDTANAQKNTAEQNYNKAKTELDENSEKSQKEFQQTAQSIQAVGTAAMIAGGLLFTLSSILAQSTNPAVQKGAKVLKTFAVGLTVFGTALKLGQLAVSIFAKTVTAEITAIPIIGWIAGILAVATTVFSIIIDKSRAAEEEYKKLIEAADKTTEGAKKVQEEYIKANELIEKINEKEKIFDSLIQGTNEWKTAIDELNKSIHELLEIYPEIGQFIRYDEKGQMFLDTTNSDFKTWQTAQEEKKQNSEVISSTADLTKEYQRIEKNAKENPQYEKGLKYDKFLQDMGKIDFSGNVIERKYAEIYKDFFIDIKSSIEKGLITPENLPEIFTGWFKQKQKNGQYDNYNIDDLTEAFGFNSDNNLFLTSVYSDIFRAVQDEYNLALKIPKSYSDSINNIVNKKYENSDFISLYRTFFDEAFLKNLQNYKDQDWFNNAEIAKMANDSLIQQEYAKIIGVEDLKELTTTYKKSFEDYIKAQLALKDTENELSLIDDYLGKLEDNKTKLIASKIITGNYDNLTKEEYNFIRDNPNLLDKLKIGGNGFLANFINKSIPTQEILDKEYNKVFNGLDINKNLDKSTKDLGPKIEFYSNTLGQMKNLSQEVIEMIGRGGNVDEFWSLILKIQKKAIKQIPQEDMNNLLEKVDFSKVEDIENFIKTLKALGVDIDEDFTKQIIEATKAVKEFNLDDFKNELKTASSLIKSGKDIKSNKNYTISEEEYAFYKELAGEGFNNKDWVHTLDGYVYVGEKTNSILETINSNLGVLIDKRKEEVQDSIDRGENIEKSLDKVVYEGSSDQEKITVKDFFDKVGTESFKPTEAMLQAMLQNVAKEIGVDISYINTATEDGLFAAKKVLQDYYNKYYGAEGTQLTQNKLNIAELAKYAGVEVIGTGDQVRMSGGTAEQQAAAYIQQANENGIDLELLLNYTNALQTNNEELEIQHEMAMAIAYDNIVMSQGIETLKSNFEKWNETLEKTKDASGEFNTNSKDYIEIANNLRKVLQQITGTEYNFSNSVLTSTENLELFKKAAEGDTDAINQLRKAGAKDILNLDSLGENGQKIQNWLDNVDLDEDITFGATLDTTGMDTAFQALMDAGLLTADQVNQALESIGFEPQVDWIEADMSTLNEADSTVKDFDGNVHSTKSIQEINGKTMIPVINGKGTTYKGGAKSAMPSTTTSGGSKGGGGGGGGGKKEFKNDFDKYYNMVEDINELTRLRNLLETDYNQLLKSEAATGKQIYDNLKQQIKLLQERRDITADLAEKRKQQIIDETKKKENKDLAKYAWWNETDNTIEIDWDKINKVKDSELGDRIKEFVSILEDFQSKYDEQVEALEDIESTLQEIEKRGRDQYTSLEDRVRDALIKQIQDKIDEFTAVDEAINNTNQKLLDSITKTLEKQRQERENAKTEEDLADKEQRLAYLQQDSSGANALEIAKLQEELADARENYTDTLIDQKISELQEQNDEAAQQRQEQIELMQQSLDWQEKSGAFWEEVYRLIDEGTSATGELIHESELQELLQAGENWESLSEEQKKIWAGDLQTTVAEAVSYLYLSRQLENLGVKKGTEITFTNAEGQVLTGKVDKKGNVVVDNGDGTTTTYKDVYQSYDGTYHTMETSKDAKTKKKKTSNTSGNNNSSNKHENTTPPTKKPYTLGTNTVWKYPKEATDGNGEYDSMDAAGKAAKTANDDQEASLQKKIDDLENITGPLTSDQQKELQGAKQLLAYRAIAAKGYKTGGLADYTGPAWLDGTPSRPELILNARDTENFIQLKDTLSDLKKYGTTLGLNGGDNYYDIDVHVDEISSDYDVDRLADRLKTLIYKDGQYRNVNVLNRLR